MPDRPLLIFDGNCGFCRIWIGYLTQLTDDRVDYAPSQEIGYRYPQIGQDAFSRSVQLVQPNGSVLSGAQAVFETLRYAPERAWLARLYQHTPAFATISEWVYRFIAANRSLFYHLTRIFFGRKVAPARFASIEWLFVRVLAAIYLIAFVSFSVQVIGLIGSRGILPAGNYLQFVSRNFGASRFWDVPTIFWINWSDVWLQAACVAGAALSIVLLLGFFQRICLAVLYVLYLSLCSTGQDFMSYQWDMLLLEAGFLAIFLGSSLICVWLYRCLLFRLMFLSGAVKLLSHDPSWRSLDALRFHYWTQPLPTPLGWYMSQLPAGFQRASTAMTLGIELFVPFLMFLPRRARIFGAGCLILLQALIFATGNYTFFNLLTIALCLFLFDDRDVARFHVGLRPLRRLNSRVLVPVACVILLLGVLQLSTALFGAEPGLGRSLLRLTAPFGIVNSYGLFAVMTTSRPEIVVQGSDDGTNWLDYEFKYKAGDLRRPPPWVAPHQPRLDWQMWFAALSDWRGSPWFVAFVLRLLDGSQPVLDLMAKNPFPARAPRYVRALRFDYYFTSPAERGSTGQWWKRDSKGLFFPAVSLRDFQTK